MVYIFISSPIVTILVSTENKPRNGIVNSNLKGNSCPIGCEEHTATKP